MIKLIYFDFNFWRIDVLRLCLSYSNVPYDYKRIKRQEWPKEKKKFPFGQLPIMVIDNKKYAHTHSLARFCAIESNLYANDKLKAIVIDQVLDWANEITNKIAPSIRAAMRDKDFEKSKKLREEFIKNDLLTWFSYLENLFDQNSSKKVFFNDKFSIADITAWRIIYWFYCGRLDQINNKFLDKFPLIQIFFKKMNTYKPFIELEEYKDIIS
jgi:glutathione S-transferase